MVYGALIGIVIGMFIKKTKYADESLRKSIFPSKKV